MIQDKHTGNIFNICITSFPKRIFSLKNLKAGFYQNLVEDLGVGLDRHKCPGSNNRKFSRKKRATVEPILEVPTINIIYTVN